MKFLKKIFLLILFLINNLAFTQTPLLYFSPSNQNIKLDSTGTIKLQIDNVQNLHSYSVKFSYNPAYLKLESVSELSFFSNYNTFFSHNVDSTNGWIRIECAILGAYSQSGSGELAEIKFIGRSTGQVNMTFIETDLRNHNNQSITINTQGGIIVIGPASCVRDISESNIIFNCYPNPFNSIINITFRKEEKISNGLYIINSIGQVVKHYHDMENIKSSYSIQWDGTNDYGEFVPAGVYFISFQNSNLAQASKVLYLK